MKEEIGFGCSLFWLLNHNF